MSRAHSAPEDLPPSLPEPWWVAAHALVDDHHPAATGPLTSLVAYGEIGEVIIAEAMELASWSEIRDDDVQVRLCRDPGCGMEHCLVGSWVRLSADEHAVLLGPTEESTASDPSDRSEYAPPAWMIEHGPCLISSERWDLIADQFEARTSRVGARSVRIPSFSELRAAGRRPAAGLTVDCADAAREASEQRADVHE